MRRHLFVLLVALGVLGSSCAYRYETEDLVAEGPPPVAQSSFMFDAKGRQILLLRADENRVYKRIEQIPKVLKDAVVAIEDERYYLHKGVDLKGLVRSARTNVSAGSVSQGASTITQQYVGNVYLDRSDRSAKRKLQEIALARQFEQKYTKDYILELYLNWVFLGNGSSGVQAAARGYFNKDVAELTLAEAALVAGLIQRPSELDPYRSSESFEAAKRRRNQVLERMRVNEFITDEEYAQAVQAPLVLKPYVPITNETYEAAHFVEEVKKWFLANPKFGATAADREKLLFEGGLRISTTVDLDLQRAAEEARNGVLPSVDGLDAAIVTMDPATGNVLAMVGGKNYFGPSRFAKVNLAAGDGRQTGSSAKPIGLAAALSQGIPLTTTYPAPSNIELPIPGLRDPWKVKGGSDGGNVTLIEATEQSYNTVYAQLIMDLGPDKFVDMAAKLGVTHKVEPVHAAILGTENITMLEMATAFGTFASRGVRRDPVLVTKIVNPDGTTLYEHTYTQTKALEPTVADQMNSVLQGAVSQGTGTAARLGNRPVAGKTGSAENNADATFVGYTPNRVTAVWVGFPEGQVPMVPPRTPITVFGGTYPARIFQRVMTAATEGLPPAEFVAPPPLPTTTTTTIVGETVAVPDVRGLTQAAAQARLADAGFTVNAVNVETAEFAVGTVANQAPRAGAPAPRGTKVTIEVATAPKASAVTVPNVVGLTRAAARSQLVAAGFAVLELFEPAPAGTTPAPVTGSVWRQTPGAGSPKPADGVVQLSLQP